jgi:phosphotransferase system HPr-like phosphotransfer protein
MLSRTTMQTCHFQKLHQEQLVELAKIANFYQSYILIEINNSQFNAKSVLSMISMPEYLEGDTLLITAQGDDSKEAVAHVCQFVTEIDDSLVQSCLEM